MRLFYNKIVIIQLFFKVSSETLRDLSLREQVAFNFQSLERRRYLLIIERTVSNNRYTYMMRKDDEYLFISFIYNDL